MGSVRDKVQQFAARLPEPLRFQKQVLDNNLVVTRAATKLFRALAPWVDNVARLPVQSLNPQYSSVAAGSGVATSSQALTIIDVQRESEAALIQRFVDRGCDQKLAAASVAYIKAGNNVNKRMEALKVLFEGVRDVNSDALKEVYSSINLPELFVMLDVKESNSQSRLENDIAIFKGKLLTSYAGQAGLSNSAATDIAKQAETRINKILAKQIDIEDPMNLGHTINRRLDLEAFKDLSTGEAFDFNNFLQLLSQQGPEAANKEALRALRVIQTKINGIEIEHIEGRLDATKCTQQRRDLLIQQALFIKVLSNKDIFGEKIIGCDVYGTLRKSLKDDPNLMQDFISGLRSDREAVAEVHSKRFINEWNADHVNPDHQINGEGMTVIESKIADLEGQIQVTANSINSALTGAGITVSLNKNECVTLANLHSRWGNEVNKKLAEQLDDDIRRNLKSDNENIRLEGLVTLLNKIDSHADKSSLEQSVKELLQLSDLPVKDITTYNRDIKPLSDQLNEIQKVQLELKARKQLLTDHLAQKEAEVHAPAQQLCQGFGLDAKNIYNGLQAVIGDELRGIDPMHDLDSHTWSDSAYRTYLLSLRPDSSGIYTIRGSGITGDPGEHDLNISGSDFTNLLSNLHDNAHTITVTENGASNSSFQIGWIKDRMSVHIKSEMETAASEADKRILAERYAPEKFDHMKFLELVAKVLDTIIRSFTAAVPVRS